MCISMVVNVLVNNIVCHVTASRAKVTSAPEVISPVFLLQLRKIYLHFARTAPFNFLDKLAHRYVRRNTAKDVYMITGNYPIKYLDVHLISYLSNQIANTRLQRPPKYFVTILCDPYQMVTVIVRRVAAFAILRHSYKTTTSYYCAKPEGSLV